MYLLDKGVKKKKKKAIINILYVNCSYTYFLIENYYMIGFHHTVESFLFVPVEVNVRW